MADLAPLIAQARAWAAALTLILIIFALNILGRFIGRFSKVNK